MLSLVALKLFQIGMDFFSSVEHMEVNKDQQLFDSSHSSK